MDVYRFNQLTLADQVLLIPLKGRFIAQRESGTSQVMLYYWANHFIEIHYRWPVHRGAAGQWEACAVSTFADEAGCTDRLLPYVEQFNLSAIHN